MLVHRLGDPLGVWVVADGRMVGIDEDDLVELVRRVLANPVRVENTKRSAAATNTLLEMTGMRLDVKR